MNNRVKAVLLIIGCFAVPSLVLMPLNLVPPATVDLDVVTDRMSVTVGDLSALGLTQVPLLQGSVVDAVSFTLPRGARVELPDGIVSFRGDRLVGRHRLEVASFAAQGTLWLRPQAPSGNALVIESAMLDPSSKLVIEFANDSDRYLSLIVHRGGISGAVGIPDRLMLEGEYLRIVDQSGRAIPLDGQVAFENTGSGLLRFAVDDGAATVSVKTIEKTALIDHWIPVADDISFQRDTNGRLVRSSITGPGRAVISETGQVLPIHPHMTVEPAGAEGIVIYRLEPHEAGLRVMMSGRLDRLTIGWGGGENVLPSRLQHYEAMGFLKSYYALVVIIGTAILAIMTRIKVIAE